MFKNYRYNTFTCHLSYYKIPGHYKLDSLEVKEITLLIFPGEKLLFSHSVMSDSWWPHGLQHARLPCPSVSPSACSNSCVLSWWCHPIISSSVALFSSCLQPFPAAGSFPVSWLFALSGQNTGASASASVELIFRVDFLQDWMVWCPYCPRLSQESSPTPQLESLSSSVLTFPYSPTLTSIHDYWKNHSFN